jgi:hypothetical protein
MSRSKIHSDNRRRNISAPREAIDARLMSLDSYISDARHLSEGKKELLLVRW